MLKAFPLVQISGFLKPWIFIAKPWHGVFHQYRPKPTSGERLLCGSQNQAQAGEGALWCLRAPDVAIGGSVYCLNFVVIRSTASAHAIEQQHIGVLRLDAQVLLHHRSVFCGRQHCVSLH